MESIGGSSNMEIRAKFLNEGLKKWTFYQYHYPKWKQTLKEFEHNEQALNEKWITWADCFTKCFQPVWEKAFQKDSPTEYWDVRSTLKDADEAQQKFLYNMNQFGDAPIWEWWMELRFNGDRHENDNDEFCLLSIKTMIGLFHLIQSNESSTFEKDHLIKDMSILVEALAIPPWLWSDLLELEPTITDFLKTHIRGLKKPYFTFEVSVQGDIKHHEKARYSELFKILERNDLLEIERLRHSFDGIQILGQYYYVLMLLYSLDKNLLVDLLCPIEQPFVISNLCNTLMFKNDLELFSLISKVGGKWAQIEVANHLLGLLLERDLSSYFKPLLYDELTAVLQLLFSYHDQQIYQWLLDYFRPWEELPNNNIPMLAACIGNALVASECGSSFSKALKNWDPFIHRNKLEEFLIEIDKYFYNNGDHEMLKFLHQGIISVWIRMVLGRYFNKKYTNNIVPITFLENAAIRAISSQGKSPNRILRIITQLLNRIDAIETKWYRDSTIENAEKDALFMALLVFSYVLTNSSSTDSFKEDVKKRIFLKTRDQRNWKISKDDMLEKPFILESIEKAWVNR